MSRLLHIWVMIILSGLFCNYVYFMYVFEKEYLISSVFVYISC